MRNNDIGTKYGKLTIIGIPSKTKITYRCECAQEFTADFRSEVTDCGCTEITVTPGQQFGPVTVIGRAGMEFHNRTRVKVKCLCGFEDIVTESQLGKESYHLRCPWKSPLIGQRFGRLVVKEPTGERVRVSFEYTCECDCGGSITAISAELKRQSVQSCGCLQKEIARERGKAGFPTAKVVGFPYAHKLVQQARGDASEYGCWDCDGDADVWSFNKGAKYALTVVSGPYRGYHYSMDPQDYDPRCSGCHGEYVARQRTLMNH